MAFAPYLAGTIGGIAGSMIVGDTLKAVPVRQASPNVDANASPMTTSASTPRTTGDGTPVPATTQLSARGVTHLAAGMIVVALIIVLFGARYFRNAKIG